MIKRRLGSDRYQTEFSFAFLIDGYVAEVYCKIEKDYCKVDKIYDKNVVDVSADDFSRDTTEVSGDDQKQERKACSFSSS